MNLACANKQCKAELKYLRGGRLFLMERRMKATPVSMSIPQTQTSSQVEPFRHDVALRRYFWLCESCAKEYVIRSWTQDGVELAPRKEVAHIQNSSLSREWVMPGLVG